MSTGPWNDWYHCMWNTYGTWLPGDPRGFRTRHHREHVEGDYKNPPPKGKYDKLHESSERLLKGGEIWFTLRQRRRACEELTRSLLKRKIEVVTLAVDSNHVHLLARFPDHNPRRWTGLAKKECSHYMKTTNDATRAVWATRSLCRPVVDRNHQMAVATYILRHAAKGAAIWTIPTLHRRVKPADARINLELPEPR